VSTRLTLEVRNKHGAIAPASEAAEAWLEEAGAGPKGAYFVLLALEELATNCIKYAYDDEGEHTIGIEIEMDGPILTMRVMDDGHAFNPLDAPAPDLELGVHDRPVGGLGIHLLREMADEAVYERRDGKNRLTLKKRIG
jgi:anti-sigma regulatory factor (Ser/Thr protein kinase)